MHLWVVARGSFVVLGTALVVVGSAQPDSRGFAQSASSGFVYVMTNDPAANSVIQYARDANGSLTKLGQTSTDGNGGTGNGVGGLDPLGSQDSLVLAGSATLVGVNAGSGTLFSVGVTSSGLHLLNTASSGGVFPNSVAVHGDLVYVLNAHSTPPNISGFRLGPNGLTAIPNSTAALPGFTASTPNVGPPGPHDIKFSPDGTRLIVSEGGATNLIDVFQLDSTGRVSGVRSTPSAGMVPFGMNFGRAGVLLNTEAGSDLFFV